MKKVFLMAVATAVVSTSLVSCDFFTKKSNNNDPVEAKDTELITVDSLSNEMKSDSASVLTKEIDTVSTKLEADKAPENNKELKSEVKSEKENK